MIQMLRADSKSSEDMSTSKNGLNKISDDTQEMPQPMSKIFPRHQKREKWKVNTV